MPSATTILHVRGLGKQKMTALTQKAKRLGMTTEHYVRQLVEEDLAIERVAQNTSFAELLAPVRVQFKVSGTSEKELDRLVDAARSRYSIRTAVGRGKR